MSIIDNRKAYHDYFIEEKYEAGLVLEGCGDPLALGTIRLRVHPLVEGAGHQHGAVGACFEPFLEGVGDLGRLGVGVDEPTDAQALLHSAAHHAEDHQRQGQDAKHPLGEPSRRGTDRPDHAGTTL